MNSCTPKEWDTCRVEKRGCPGCHYEDKHKCNKEECNKKCNRYKEENK